MQLPTGTLIRVYDHWNGWHSAEIRIEDFQGVHWFQPPGAPHRMLHGFIQCTNLVTGTIPHDCDGSSSHRLMVCVLKKQTASTAFEELVHRADAHTRPIDDSPSAA